MRNPNLFHVCNCFSFTFRSENKSLRSIMECITANGSCGIIFTDCDILPFSDVEVGVLLFNTYMRKAYDIYKLLDGKCMRSVEPVTVQSILIGLGIYEIPNDYICIPISTGIIFCDSNTNECVERGYML